jgi:hypothetical protein
MVQVSSRFFDAMGYLHGQMRDYSNIAREGGLAQKQ